MLHINWPNSKSADELRHYKHSLDFKNEGLSEIHIHAPEKGFSELSVAMATVREKIGSELKWVLSQEITVFIKNRGEGDSKALIAHPEEKEWVVSLSFNSEDFSEFLKHLTQIAVAPSFELRDFIRLGRVSNLNIKFFLAPLV